MKVTIFLVYCAIISTFILRSEGACYKKSTKLIPDHIISPLQHVDNLPEQHIWDNVNCTNFLTLVRNERAPLYCDGCWAHAAASALSDRIKIKSGGAFPDVNISPQLFLSCSENDSGCEGGDPKSAFLYGYENELTDETCTIYQGRGRTNGLTCSPALKCRSCYGATPCYIPDKYLIYKVKEFGSISGETNMMQEIYQRGPIVCNIAEPKNLDEGIYKGEIGDQTPTHSVEIVGYGVENGTKFWYAKNSWGAYWGDHGYFKIERGSNTLLVESDCIFAEPEDSWTNQKYHFTTQEEKDDPTNDYSNGPYFMDRVEPLTLNDQSLTVINVPKKFYETKLEGLPNHIDWRNMNGINYMSWSKNQHTPQYCGNCWAHSSSSALSDRFNILNWKINGNIAAKQVSISNQVLVNCHMGGTCWGGNPIAVYQKMMYQGVPDDSCSPYVARNLDPFELPDCKPSDVCKTCTGPVPQEGEDGAENCHAVENYTNYYVSGYNIFSTAEDIKKEIALFGPVACGIKATAGLKNYTGGIYEEKAFLPIMNHIISLVGYGIDSDTGTEYWIGRNTWGTYWGENGYFRIKMYKDNLGVESYCSSGYPTYEKPKSSDTQKTIKNLAK